MAPKTRFLQIFGIKFYPQILYRMTVAKQKKKNVKRERLLSHALTFFLVCGDYSSGRAKTSSLAS